jgi:hypothetical protein
VSFADRDAVLLCNPAAGCGRAANVPSCGGGMLPAAGALRVPA